MEHMRFVNSFAAEESGQDLVEYALLALIIALGSIAGMSTLANSIAHVFTTLQTQLT